MIAGTIIPVSSIVPERTGYTFKSWCMGTVTGDGTVCTGTEFTAGSNIDLEADKITDTTFTLTALWTANEYTIVYGTVANIAKVSLEGVECFAALSSGGCKRTLTYNETYSLVATPSTGYSLSSWSAGSYGTIASITSASTTYTVGAGNSTITPSAKVNQYTCTKRYRLQNADGSYPSSYTADGTQAVNYGATCTYTKTVTNYNSNNSKTTSCTMGTSGCTLSLDFPRNTYTISVSNSNTSSGKSSFTVLYGGSNTVTVTPSSGYYLSAVTCPSGYTCSGYTTGTSKTGQQTVTIKNNNTTSGGTLKFTGTISKLYIQNVTTSNCPTSRTQVYDSRDNKTYYIQKIGSLCWMTSNLAYEANAYKMNSTYGGYYARKKGAEACPSGWKLPATADFKALKSAISKPTNAPFYGLLGGTCCRSHYTEDGDFEYEYYEDRGTLGYYWTTNTNTANNGFPISIQIDKTSFSSLSHTMGGHTTVRCIAS